jgi:hypothetical protein
LFTFLLLEEVMIQLHIDIGGARFLVKPNLAFEIGKHIVYHCNL